MEPGTGFGSCLLRQQINHIELLESRKNSNDVRINTVTGYGVHLGAYVETKNSNFARGNTVSHLTYIGDSDVGKFLFNWFL